MIRSLTEEEKDQVFTLLKKIYIVGYTHPIFETARSLIKGQTFFPGDTVCIEGATFNVKAVDPFFDGLIVYTVDGKGVESNTIVKSFEEVTVFHSRNFLHIHTDLLKQRGLL